MRKIFNYLSDNILFFGSLFLLIFIPLYPKLPILDVQNTWVYIRIEDFLVFFVIFAWIILLLKRKISIKTPLTIPILVFWIIGAVATLHGILLVFPDLANVFPNVAFFSLIRHIEYLSLFFIGYHGFNDKKHLNIVIFVLTVTFLAVSFYGIGQKYLGFPAFLTSNEEFAKGEPITLSALSRVPATFAGHYDFAGYLVLMVPILLSLVFGFKNLLLKIFFLGAFGLGFVMMFFTVSRISLVALGISAFVVLFFQKKWLALLSIPFAVVLGIGLLSYQPTILERFSGTVSEVDVVVDARTGQSVGHVKFVPKDYLKDKIILQQQVQDGEELALILSQLANDSDKESSLIYPFRLVPETVPLVTAVNVSNGEFLPQGTGYINLSLSPVTQRFDRFFYEFSPDYVDDVGADVIVFRGPFIVKRASAYDLSFTTRFQGEWPNAIDAFKNNVFLGSGYGSVTLAVDNNYLRILGEIGILGFGAFILLFLSLAIYIRKVFPNIDSPVARAFVIGYGAGLIGLAINATLIDIWEASKVAFVMWLLFGIVMSLLYKYQKGEISLLNEFKKLVKSPITVILILLVLTVVLFIPSLNDFFVGDDFTWFRWAAQCGADCNLISTITSYFTQSDGFFYRPGSKIYYLLMYKSFWLNQTTYHLVSLILHFSVAVLFFFLSKKIFKNSLYASIAAISFLILSGITETVFWISTTGHLFTAMFGLAGVLLYINWYERKNLLYLILSILSIGFSLLFHEYGIVFPLIIVLYVFIFGKGDLKHKIKRWDLYVGFIPVILYGIARYLSNSHWFSGDYSYNIFNLPFNIAGNLFGYGLLTVFGPITLPIYNLLRDVLRQNIIIAVLLIPVVLIISYLIYKYGQKYFDNHDKKVIIFGLLFFAIALIPFLGLGNITSRYSYLGAMGLIFVFVIIARKTYEFLIDLDKKIAIFVTVLLALIFFTFHVIQIQQTYFNWNEAGSKVQNFFLSVDGQYENIWSGDDVEFHFVEVPLKVGDAWVFPVGLEDALWFAIQNNNAKVIKHNTLEEALRASESKINRPVLKFAPDGSLQTPYEATTGAKKIFIFEPEIEAEEEL